MSAGRLAELESLFAGRKGDLLSVLEELVTRESPSDDPERVGALARWIARRIAAAGLVAEILPCAGRGDALRVRRGDAGGTLVLGHLDTVWPAGTLAERPFRVEGGIAQGPGVFDMKGGVAVALAVLEAVGRGEVRPAGGLSLLLTPDEEVGSAGSRELLVAEAKRHDRAFVLEPAGDGGAAKIARKGVGLAMVRFRGLAAHAGLEPEKGASALAELARCVQFAEALADRGLGTTVLPTCARAGSKANVVPERGELTVDFRFWTPAEGARVEAALRAYRGADPRVRVEMEGGLNRPPMEVTGPSLELYRTAAALSAQLGFPLPSARVGGASDGNLTASAGVPTLDGLGPAGGGAHARTEHLLVDDLPRRCALLAGLLEGVPA
ncbi:MAG: M20 family metallopeptidase [Acidithiobacillales bacterium]